MVKSDKCNLHGLRPKELVEKQEEAEVGCSALCVFDVMWSASGGNVLSSILRILHSLTFSTASSLNNRP